MKVINLILALILVAVFAISCSTVMPINATSNTLGNKIGKSTASLIFGLPTGDGGILKAAQNGGITKISTVDQKIELPFLVPIIVKMVTIVSGE